MTRLILLVILLGVVPVSAAWPVEVVSGERGWDVGDGQVLYDTPYDPKHLESITFVAPTAAHPFYEIVVPLSDWSEGKGATVQKVLVNGVESDSFYVFVDGFSHVQSAWITREAETALNVVLVTRSVWHNGEDTSIEVHISGSSEPIIKKFDAKAPAKGGVPKEWRRYQSLVLSEDAGLARNNEPVEVSLTVRAEDCADLERELCLFVIAPDTGELDPVNLQTFNVQRFPGRPPGTSNPNYLQHPSKSLEAVFLACVPANSARVYIFLYDNPSAKEPKPADTDLKIDGAALGAIVENAYYIADLDDKSGQIASFEIKGRGDHPAPKLTNSLTYAVHWNPDSFSDSGLWGHTFAWNPPDETVISTRGPIMFRVTNSGRMPDRTPQVHASVTYSFYASVPYVKVTTITEVRDPLNVSALRNGEIVLDSHLVTHFVWQEKNGKIKTVRTLHGPNWQDEWAARVDHDVPWLAITHEPESYGIAELIVNSLAFNPNRGEAITHRPAFYLYYHHFWTLPVSYFTRAWVYPFSDYQRGPILPVDAGSTYVEKAAFLPCTLGQGDTRYARFQAASYQLRNPLVQRWGR